MTHGFTTLRLKQNNSQSNGNSLTHPHQRRPWLSSWQGKSWRLFFCFFGADGVLLLHFLQKGHIVNRQYYTTLLWQLQYNIIAKCCGKLTKGMLFHQDNASAHKSAVTLTVAFNWMIIHHILKIWHHLTSICPQTWRNTRLEDIFPLKMLLWWMQRHS